MGMISAIRGRAVPAPVSKAVDRFLQVSLLGMLASGYLAVALTGALDAATLAVTGGAIVLRALMMMGLARARVSERAATALALGYIGFFPLDYYYLSGEFLPATVHLVFFLAAVLVVKASTRRDYFFLKLIALLQILAASLLAASVHFLICLGVFVLCGIAAQTSGEIDGNLKARGTAVAREGMRGAHRRLAGLVAMLFAGILVLAGSLFFVLPRTAHAALRHLIPDRYHLPGFSNELSLGQIGELRMTSTPVMHVKIHGPSPGGLKWRGSALSQFDGKRWYNESDRGERIASESGLVRLANYAQQWRKGQRIIYDVQLKSVTSDVLFFAGTPEFVSIESPQVIRTAVDGYRLGAGMGRGLRYRAYSFLEEPGADPHPAAGGLSAAERAAYLRTPAGLDPRIGGLARRVSAGASGTERARSIEQHLSTTYGYTTELLKKEVPDALSHFLFTRRKGHCEYFASSMAVMLRTIGIPSRVATGFQSGVYNPISGWHLIRSADAHSWVEAWFPGRGWVTFDPTPPAPLPSGSSVWERLLLYYDAMEIFWQDWVMSYDLERQLLLADRMGQSGKAFSADWIRGFRDWKLDWERMKVLPGLPFALALAGTLVWILLAVWFGPGVWAWWKTRRRLRMLQTAPGNAGDATVLYQRMLRLLERRGVRKPAWVTPGEFARMVPGAHGRIVGELTREYHALRFGSRGESAPRMVTLLEELEQASAG